MHVKEDFADQRREDGVDTARTVRCTSPKAFMSLLTITLVAPTYERLADAFPSVRYYIYTKMKDLQLTDILQNKVIIAKTDADGVGRELGSRFGVSGFPSMSLKPMPLGSVILTDSQLSNGSLLAPLSPYLTAALETLKPLLHCQYYHFGCAENVLLNSRFVSSVTKQSGVKSNIKPPPPPAYTELDVSNFDEIALNESKDVLVAFTAPWVSYHRHVTTYLYRRTDSHGGRVIVRSLQEHEACL